MTRKGDAGAENLGREQEPEPGQATLYASLPALPLLRMVRVSFSLVPLNSRACSLQRGCLDSLIPVVDDRNGLA